MLITEKTLGHWINNFYGYGSWAAPIWLIGYEEPGGDLPEEVAEKLDYFYKIPDAKNGLCELHDLYRHVTFRADGPRAELFSTLHDYRFGTRAIPHGVWKNLIAFVHGCNDEPLPDLLDYQKRSLTKTKEAMLTLLPLPSPHAHAWYYSWLDIPAFGFLKRRTQYEEQVYPHRIKTILDNVRAYRPRVVLMYEMNNINKLKKSVQEFFPEAAFKMVKGQKEVIPQHHYTTLNTGTTLVITTQVPALKHNRAGTGFDWEEFGRSVPHQT